MPHLGNYLGAMRNWVALQEQHEALFCVVDLHAMTLPWDPDELRRQTVEVGASLLAVGIDPERSVVFIQSQVPAHAELAWILNCIGRMGELRRMVQFKEKSKGESESVPVGLFTYPLLQAADILLYRTNGVPVGEDQRQHIELTRDVAQRFNSTFGETFVLPEAWIQPEVARIMALDDPTQKMSKSAARPASSILLTDDRDEIERKIRSAVTDSGREVRAADDKPALTNLLTIFSALASTPVEELEDRFAGKGYGAFKQEMGALIADHLEPIRMHYEELMQDPSQIEKALGAGAERAAALAEGTLDAVREAVGLPLGGAKGGR